ncbi:MAG: phospho-sugar mutase [Acidimicrobiales bacterium]|nr:phospho-sugar mutase [Acidimicrobiales bacterium]
MVDRALRARVEAWQAQDPDPVTVAEADSLLAAGDEIALRDRFDHRLRFGTAGLRGALGAGPNRMNRVVVRRAAAGLAAWLDASGRSGPVVVGRDARHGSEVFAVDSARVLAGAGRRVFVVPDPCPTSLVAYAARALEAPAAVMVTASHNPPGDNGYKVFADGAAQIAPPLDDEIAAAIDDAGPADRLPLAAPDAPAIEALPASVEDRYLTGIAALRCAPDAPPVRVAYTPLHGVGTAFLRRAFATSGLGEPDVVAQQAEPDPDFPTVPFPNPEEPGAMDLVLGLAAELGADLALANDPDADRLAVAVPSDGGWRVLTGDEVGVLLADHLLSHGSGPDRLVATTVVSSSMLSSIAAAHGVHFVETLTGFKWLVRAAMARPELTYVLGYEEALGYGVGDLVRDKDGISAAVIVTELVAELAARGSSVPQRLDELAREFGVHHTMQWSKRFEGPGGAEVMASRVDALRVSPPSMLGDRTVERVEDLARGERLPPTDALVLHVRGARATVRPSGTEPKLKVYLEIIEFVSGEAADARVRAAALGDAVLADLAALLG